MSVLHGMDNDQLGFKLARMANCLERLLVSDFPATDLHWLIHRVLGTDSGTITFDTSGVRRIGVSFFDEALLIFNEIVAETGNNELRLVYHKAPPTDSLKNLVGNRGLTLSETDTGDWIIAQPAIF